VTFFRPQSLHSQQTAWLGSIQVVRPVGLNWLTLWVLATLVAVSTLLFVGSYTRKARLAGVIAPDRGLIRVVPPVSGSVETLLVAEGQLVRAGEPLAVLRTLAPAYDADAQARLSRSFSERLQSFGDADRQARARAAEQVDALTSRIEAARRELAQVDAQSRLQAERLELSRSTVQRWEDLAKQNFVSAAQVQTRREELLALQAEQVEIDRRRENLRRGLTDLEAQRREVPLALDEKLGQLARDRAEVAESAARDETAQHGQRWTLRAPADGTVSALNVKAGQSVDAQSAVVALVPAGTHWQATLYAPSSALGFIEPGQDVHLRLQAYPYQKYGLQQGRVIAVSHAPLAVEDLPAPADAHRTARDSFYRVDVSLDTQGVLVDGAMKPLLAGMELDADVLLERRRLIEWLFEPLLGWSRRL